MGDYQPETECAFVVCHQTNLLPKRVFEIFSHCNGLVRVDLMQNKIVVENIQSVPKTRSGTMSPGKKTAYVKFSDTRSAEKAIDEVDGHLICKGKLEISTMVPLELESVPASGADSWDHADQARWGRGNNALVASMLKVLSTKQVYDSDHIRPGKFDDFKVLYNEEVKRLSGVFPSETVLRRQRRVYQYFKYEVSISYHQLLQARKAVKSSQDLDISRSKISEHILQDLLIDFRLFATRIKNMRFIRITLKVVIDLTPRKDEAQIKNVFMVGDYLAETNGSTELPVVFQERMYRCLHDDLEKLYAGEIETDMLWEDAFDQAIERQEGAAKVI